MCSQYSVPRLMSQRNGEDPWDKSIFLWSACAEPMPDTREFPRLGATTPPSSKSPDPSAR